MKPLDDLLLSTDPRPHVRFLQNSKKRTEFFFAEAAAGMYDVTIGMVVPHYHVMHQVVIHFLRGKHFRKGDLVLDVGSGTGADSIAVLSEFPQVQMVSIDLCQPIQDIHRKKLEKLDTPALRLRERSKLICADILAYDSGSELLSHFSRGRKFAAIVSSLTIHHLEHAEKQWFYRLMSDTIASDGRLINADLFSYVDSSISKSALAFDMNWMRHEFVNPGTNSAKHIPLLQRRRLLNKWIKHYRTANRLEPLEDAGDAQGQLTMLKQAGFRSVSVPYRMSLSGIVIAEK